MKKLIKKISFLVGIFIFSSLIGFNFKYQDLYKIQINNDNLKEAQSEFSDNSLTVSLNFSLLEESENVEQQKNVSSVDINLGTSRWNITTIELNITDMNFKNETKTVEDKDLNTKDKIDKFSYDCLAVEIEILAPTILYGVYIYGQNKTTETDIKNVQVQIQGVEKNTGKPNMTKLIDVSLNMSKSLGKLWHLQKFTPLSLQKGYYYLVIDGSDIMNKNGYFYEWYYCDEGANYPYLNISKNGGSWSDPQQNSPYLYKLIQKVDKSFYPEEINMTATINGENNPIKNGNQISTGKLSLAFSKYKTDTPLLHIPIKNNISNALFFNLSYYIKLNNSISSKSLIIIKENLKNFWTIESEMYRFGKNYTIKFKYPNSWNILKVENQTDELTPGNDYSTSNNILNIFNKTILDETNYLRITANSTNFNPPIDLGTKTNYIVGENLGLGVGFPARLGNYTFVLVDPIEENVFIDFEEKIDFDKFYFNYTFPSYSRNGEWIAFVFWNNKTDAGVSTQIFQISGGSSPVIPTIEGGNSNGDSTSATTIEGITPTVFLVVIISITVGFSGIVSTYVGFKAVRRKKELQKERIYNEFMDIYNLSYIMISHRKSGLNVFEKNFAGANLNPTLISGYLSALNVFGLEITGSFEQSHSTKLEFQNLFILMNDFKDLRIIVILKENPSKNLLKTISRLSYEINNDYGDKIEKFDGERFQFEKIGDLIEKHLKISLISPLQVKKIDLSLLNQTETAIIQKAKHIVKKNNFPYIFASYLIPGQQFDYDYAKAIIDLIDKRILIPLKSENIK